MTGKSQASPSVLSGTAIIAVTAVGAAMFSLPVVSAGMWFPWSLVCLVGTWFFMYHSGLMILETNLNFPAGSSFDTITKETLGPTWNHINGLSVLFVLYTLAYAYISGAGSSISNTLHANSGISVSAKFTGLMFALFISTIVWANTKTVSRIATVMLGALAITFALLIGNLITKSQITLLLDRGDSNSQYFPFLFAALPFYLASFGFHANVPSLMKYYGKDPRKIRNCLLYGTLLALAIYLLWQVSILGNVSRQEFRAIIAEGGNISNLVKTVGSVTEGGSLYALLNVFSNLAVTSSFLGVTLGLFDYISDKFRFSDSAFGRLKTATITFLPPTVGSLFYPDGFLYAIGLVGLAATIWTVIVPALMVKVSRKRFGNTIYRVQGGNTLVHAVMLFGIMIAICHMLTITGLLPIYK